MNIMLDSRLELEALAFDYVSFGIFTVVNNLWTWVALITAAVSFWRIRAAGAGGTASCSANSQPQSRPVFETFSSESTTQLSSSPSVSSDCKVLTEDTESRSKELFLGQADKYFSDDGVTKGKFVVYYEDDRESETNSDRDGEDDHSEMTVVGEWRNGNDCKDWSESWEKVLRMRMGDLEWYRYQDLTAINGNVVKLWNGVSRRNYSSSCVVVW